MEKHSTENKNAPRISYEQSDNNWINIDVHSCVLHAAVSRSGYNNFVARAALKWLCPLLCNTLRLVCVSVIASPLSPGAQGEPSPGAVVPNAQKWDKLCGRFFCSPAWAAAQITWAFFTFTFLLFWVPCFTALVTWLCSPWSLAHCQSSPVSLGEELAGL